MDGLMDEFFPVEFIRNFSICSAIIWLNYIMLRSYWANFPHPKAQHSSHCYVKKLELHMFLPQWRPTSLLTIDYIIISKVMSLRLKQILPNIIHENQLCSVTGRSIHDGCHLIRNIIDYVQDRPAMGLAIPNLDIKKPLIPFHIHT